MTGITQVDEIRMELRAACSSDVNRLLFEFVGATELDAADESALMGHIKSVAVKGLHKEVHRMNFGKIRQSDGESITHYVARLKSQASLCNFFVKCGCNLNASFAEEMISQQLVIGLRNQEHQAKVLSEVTTLATLDQKVQRLQALEATEESSHKLRGSTLPTIAGAAKSGYRRTQTADRTQTANKKFPDDKKTTPSKKCATCGRTSHYGRSMSFKDCPAANKKCNACGKDGHFKTVCRSVPTNASAVHDDEDDSDGEPSEASTSYFFATQCPEERNEEQFHRTPGQDFRLRRPKTPEG